MLKSSIPSKLKQLLYVYRHLNNFHLQFNYSSATPIRSVCVYKKNICSEFVVFSSSIHCTVRILESSLAVKTKTPLYQQATLPLFVYGAVTFRVCCHNAIELMRKLNSLGCVFRFPIPFSSRLEINQLLINRQVITLNCVRRNITFMNIRELFIHQN